MAIKITNVLKLETDGVTLPVAVLRKWLEEIPVDTTIRIMQTQEFGSSQNRTTRTILAGGEELRRLLDGQTSA